MRFDNGRLFQAEPRLQFHPRSALSQHCLVQFTRVQRQQFLEFLQQSFSVPHVAEFHVDVETRHAVRQ